MPEIDEKPARFHAYIDPDLLDQIEDLEDNLGLKRSFVATTALRLFLNAYRPALDSVKKLGLLIDKRA